MRSKEWNDESSKETSQNASQSMTSLMSTADENGHLPADLARVVVFVHVSTGIAAVSFPLHDSCNVSMPNDELNDERVLL